MNHCASLISCVVAIAQSDSLTLDDKIPVPFTYILHKLSLFIAGFCHPATALFQFVNRFLGRKLVDGLAMANILDRYFEFQRPMFACTAEYDCSGYLPGRVWT